MAVGIRGENVLLRPPREEDFEVIYALWNDPEIYRLTGDAYWIPRSRNEFRKFFEGFHLGGDRPKGGKDYAVFVIEVSGKVAGDCGMDIDWRKRVGYVWLELLPEYWGRGYGKEVLKLLEEYAKSIGLERIRAEVNGWNERSKKFFESAGWKLIAEIPENGWFNGRWWPDYIYEKRLAGRSEE